MRRLASIQLVVSGLMAVQMAGQTLTFFRPTPGISRATAVAVNASGIYVSGTGVGKYDSVGNELWTRGANGPGFGVAVDAAGVYIIGVGQNSGGPQLLLRKYGEGGNELWTRTLQQQGFTTAALAT